MKQEARTEAAGDVARMAFRVNDFCRSVGIGRSKLYDLAAQGKVRLVKIGGRTVVPASEAERLVSEGC